MSKPVALALQGGGALGAFTWGVLDCLLADPRIAIKGLSGASAGAMNAAVLAHGFALDGRDGARQALKDFWEAVASRAPFSILNDGAGPASGAAQLAGVAPLRAFLFMTHFFSPHLLNPFDINPLRDILAQQVDFERLRGQDEIALFVAATRVSSGMLRLFRNHELTLEALLASACLPALHHSIVIEGEAYWDGGLTANPPLEPLLMGCTADDMIMVLLHATSSNEIPTSADEIARRLVEVSFTAGFHAELRSLGKLKQDVERGWLVLGRLQRKLRRNRMHLIDARDYMGRLHTLSNANTHPAFIAALHDEGWNRAKLWLHDNYHTLGMSNSCRLEQILA